MLDLTESKPRIREIQRELSDLENRQKNLIQELFALMGMRPETASRKTSRNRLTPDQAMVSV